ncbi:MAG: ABC transporter substrate-binding protein [Chloroflexota bacterium]|nr:MAG: hypothetical protein DLM70_06610 [Chloroflexota bacterium]
MRLGIAMVVALAIGLSGWSGVSRSIASSTLAHTAPYTIGLSDFFIGNSWQAENISLFNQACHSHPKLVKSCIVENANGSISAQIAQIQALISRRVDAILLDANSAAGLNGVVSRALAAGIPVENYDSIITGRATSKINTNQYQWGVLTGTWLVNKLHGKGNIIVLNGLAGNPTNNLRYAYAKQLFARTKGIHVLAVGYDLWDRAKAQADVSRMLDAYPKVDGVWSQGGAMTAGAIIDFQKAGRKLVPMTGEDYNGFLKLWIQNKSKGFTSLSPGQPNYLVTLAFYAALRALHGQHFKSAVNVPLPVITDQTVNRYYRSGKPVSYWVLDKLPMGEINKLLR